MILFCPVGVCELAGRCQGFCRRLKKSLYISQFQLPRLCFQKGQLLSILIILLMHFVAIAYYHLSIRPHVHDGIIIIIAHLPVSHRSFSVQPSGLTQASDLQEPSVQVVRSKLRKNILFSQKIHLFSSSVRVCDTCSPDSTQTRGYQGRTRKNKKEQGKTRNWHTRSPKFPEKDGRRSIIRELSTNIWLLRVQSKRRRATYYHNSYVACVSLCNAVHKWTSTPSVVLQFSTYRQFNL